MLKKAARSKIRITIVLFFILTTISCTRIPSIPTFVSSSPPKDAEHQPAAPAFAPSDCNDAVCAGPEPGTYWVKNPASGARLLTRVVTPANGEDPVDETLILVPGGVGTIDPKKARRLADSGFRVIYFDPDGRGESEGTEDLGGSIHQDGLAAVIQAVASFPGVKPDKIGLVSYSYGITMASGALVRYSDLPVRFLIDWEGPANRMDTTTGCGPNQRIAWPPCGDSQAWAQREAVTFISMITIPYQRLQSEKDHVQPDLSHAIDMVNAALQGGAAWVRLNDHPVSQLCSLDALPKMLPEKSDSGLELLIARYARELFHSMY